MNKILYIFLLLFAFNSCLIIQDDRPPTVLTAAPVILPPAPVYITPFCSPVTDKTNSVTTNFNITFPEVPEITIVGNTLTYKSVNAMNDRVTIIMTPFIKGQNTVYSLVSPDKDLENYEASILLIANANSSTDKFYAKSEGNPGKYLHLRSNTSGTSYEMVFCNTKFVFYFNASYYTSTIEAKFIFDR